MDLRVNVVLDRYVMVILKKFPKMIWLKKILNIPVCMASGEQSIAHS
jgi:hypothetical protein